MGSLNLQMAKRQLEYEAGTQEKHLDWKVDLKPLECGHSLTPGKSEIFLDIEESQVQAQDPRDSKEWIRKREQKHEKTSKEAGPGNQGEFREEGSGVVNSQHYEEVKKHEFRK